MPKKSTVPEEPITDVTETPTEDSPSPDTPKKRIRIRPFDIAAFVGIAIVITLLAITLVSKLSLKHEVSTAQVTADRVVADIAKQDATDARKLGDKKFQANHTVMELQTIFKPLADIYGKTTPTVVRKNVTNNDKAQNVTFVYEYDRLKLPFYLRVSVAKPAGGDTWQLTGISGNPDQTKL